MNSVNSLLEKPYYTLSLEEKIEIKRLGGPVPKLEINQQVKSKSRGTSVQHFNVETYTKHGWLCGCSIRNLLFCFPCLLFSTSAKTKERAWTKKGVTDNTSK
jgi:hypothetical protein